MAEFTQSQLDAINAALTNGTLKVKYADKEVTYRSVDELIKVRDMIRKSLGLTNSSTRLFANFSKGHSGCG